MRQSVLSRWILCLGCILLACVPLAHAQDEADLPVLPSWCVSVWYSTSSVYIGAAESILEHGDVIDEVHPFWYNALADGTLEPVAGAEDGEPLAAWRAAGLQITPSIFSSVSTMIEDAAIRAAHVEQIRALVARMDYDGVDIDYEGFPADTREAFALFIEALSAALHADGRLLSVTVHAKTDDQGAWEGTRAQDWARLAPAADVFRIMTYDYTSRNEPPGPISPVAWVEAVLAYAETVMPLDKVRMGVPFYGYLWTRGNPPAQAVTWSQVGRWVAQFDLEIARDPDDREAQLDFRVPGLPRQVVYIADPESLTFRLERIAAAYPELGGISIWGVGGEHPQMWDIVANYSAENPDGCRQP